MTTNFLEVCLVMKTSVKDKECSQLTVKERWEKKYGRKLTEEEYRVLKTNLNSFFECIFNSFKKQINLN